MTDEKLTRLLRAIMDLAWLPHPYPEGASPADPNLLLALGKITGLASRALGDYHREHEKRSTKPWPFPHSS